MLLLFFTKRFVWCLPEFAKNSFHLSCSPNQFFDVCKHPYNAQLPDFWPQSGQESPPLLHILYLALPKQLVQSFEIPLHSFLWLLLDGIHPHSNVISIDVPIFLDHQSPQFGPVSRHKLKPLKPLLRTTT